MIHMIYPLGISVELLKNVGSPVQRWGKKKASTQDETQWPTKESLLDFLQSEEATGRVSAVWWPSWKTAKW